MQGRRYSATGLIGFTFSPAKNLECTFTCTVPEAKFWLEPAIAVAQNQELTQQQLRTVQELVEGHFFPWFRDATIAQVTHVERPSPDHLYWPDLDIDLAVASIRNPEYVGKALLGRDQRNRLHVLRAE